VSIKRDINKFKKNRAYLINNGFKIMKEYLKPMGYWKNKARGKPDANNFKGRK